MKNLVYLFFFFFTKFFAYSQNLNSLPYQGKSLITVNNHLLNIDSFILSSESQILDCRKNNLISNLIVNEEAIEYLDSLGISYEFVYENLKEKIDNENYINNYIRNFDNDNFYSIYRDLNEVYERMHYLDSISDIATLFDIGNSNENRPIKVLKLSTGGSNKPSVLFNGCQHAREWISVMASIYLADKLIEEYVDNDFINILISNIDIYIIPIVNPDGYVYTHLYDRYWRKNRQPNSGSVYIGTDLNRNWDIDWNGGESTSINPASDIFVGLHPFSATETYVLKNFIDTIQNLVTHADIHSFSSLILGPWGYTENLSDHYEDINELGNIINDAFTTTNGYNFNFGTGTANGSIYLASGTMPDWTHDQFGTLGFTFELRPSSMNEGGFELPIDQIIPACEENYNGSVEMIYWSLSDSLYGCTDSISSNYNIFATISDSSCVYDIPWSFTITGNNHTFIIDSAINENINGFELEIGDAIGVFYEYNDSVHCAGYTIWDNQVNMIAVQGDDLTTEIIDGFITGEEINWIVWDQTDQNEIFVEPIYETSDQISYSPNQINIVSGLNITSFLTEQIIPLPSGWFMFSSYIEPENLNFDTLMNQIIDNIVLIKDVEGNSFIPQWNFNSIGNFDNNQGYLMKLSISCNLNISGIKINPENFTLNFSSGWNIIPYLKTSNLNLIDAFQTIQNSIIIIKSVDGNAYLPEWNYNGIGDLVPGCAYLTKFNSEVSFNYNPD